MGSLSIWHWALFAIVALLLFGGRGKLSGLMGDAAQGIKAFKKGLKDDAEDGDKSATGAALPETKREKDEAPR